VQKASLSLYQEWGPRYCVAVGVWWSFANKIWFHEVCILLRQVGIRPVSMIEKCKHDRNALTNINRPWNNRRRKWWWGGGVRQLLSGVAQRPPCHLASPAICLWPVTRKPDRFRDAAWESDSFPKPDWALQLAPLCRWECNWSICSLFTSRQSSLAALPRCKPRSALQLPKEFF